MQVAAARLAAHFSVLADELAAEESGLHPGGQLQPLEGRIALRRFRLRGAHRPGLARVDQGARGSTRARSASKPSAMSPFAFAPKRRAGFALVNAAIRL